MYQGNGIVIAHITLNLNIFFFVELSNTNIFLCILHALTSLLFF